MTTGIAFALYTIRYSNNRSLQNDGSAGTTVPLVPTSFRTCVAAPHDLVDDVTLPDRNTLAR